MEKSENPGTPLRYGCDESWTWREHSSEVRLYGNNGQIALFHPNWSSGTAAARGSRILNNGRYYWELLLSRRIFGTSMMFGVGTKRARLHAGSFTNLLGEDEHSWGLSHKGFLWHDADRTQYTKPFRENVKTVIGVYFDGIAGTLTYYKDGKCLGVAFRGLNEIEEPLYPMISSTAAKTEMILFSTRRDYLGLQDRCRAVIVDRLRSIDDLKELLLPIRIRNYLAEEMKPKNASPFERAVKQKDYQRNDFGALIEKFN